MDDNLKNKYIRRYKKEIFEVFGSAYTLDHCISLLIIEGLHIVRRLSQFSNKAISFIWENDGDKEKIKVFFTDNEKYMMPIIYVDYILGIFFFNYYKDQSGKLEQFYSKDLEELAIYYCVGASLIREVFNLQDISKALAIFSNDLHKTMDPSEVTFTLDKRDKDE